MRECSSSLVAAEGTPLLVLVLVSCSSIAQLMAQTVQTGAVGGRFLYLTLTRFRRRRYEGRRQKAELLAFGSQIEK